MTRGSWFSGNSESSRNCMACPRGMNAGRCDVSVRFVADDPGALHLAYCGPVVLHCVVLGTAVVPDGEAVRFPAPAHLVLGNRGAADQIAQQLRGTGSVVLAETHVLRRMEIG